MRLPRHYTSVSGIDLGDVMCTLSLCTSASAGRERRYEVIVPSVGENIVKRKETHEKTLILTN